MNEKKVYIIVEDESQLRDNMFLGVYAAHHLQHLTSISTADIINEFKKIDGFQDLDENFAYSKRKKEAVVQKIKNSMHLGETDCLIEEFSAGDSVLDFIESNRYDATQVSLLLIDGNLSPIDFGNIGYSNDGKTTYEKDAKVKLGSHLTRLLIDRNPLRKENIVGATNSLQHQGDMRELGVDRWLSDKNDFIVITNELYAILGKKK